MALNIEVQAVAEYLGIDLNEVDTIVQNNLSRQISAADSFLKGAIGKDYDGDDPRAKELGIMIAAELYNTRGVMNTRQEAAFRRIASDFILQMQLEGRGDD